MHRGRQADPRRARRGRPRLIDTFHVAAEEAVRIGGEVIPLDISAARAAATAASCEARADRPGASITPVQLPAEPGGPQDRAGHRRRLPVRAQAGRRTPVERADRRRGLAEAGLPAGRLLASCPAAREGADLLVEDERFKLLTSPAARGGLGPEGPRRQEGWCSSWAATPARRGRPRPGLERRPSASSSAAFYQSGQSCISVQRIFVHAAVYDAFATRLVAARARADGRATRWTRTPTSAR